MGDEEELDAIWSEHRPQTGRRLELLRQIAQAAAAGTLGEDGRAEGIAEAHTLAGAASIFGFPEGTRLAREIERCLRDREGSAAVLPGLTDDLTRALDRDRDARGPAG